MKVQGYQRSDTTHEVRDADVLNLAMVGMLVFLIIAMALLISWIMLRYLNAGRQTNEPLQVRVAEQIASFPSPRLITRSGSERARLQLDQETRLRSYGWVDQAAGIAHIPIQRAMELLWQRGLPQAGAGQTRLQLLQSRPRTIVQPPNPITAPSPEVTP